jgi:hypothetical protein
MDADGGAVMNHLAATRPYALVNIAQILKLICAAGPNLSGVAPDPGAGPLGAGFEPGPSGGNAAVAASDVRLQADHIRLGCAVLFVHFQRINQR